MILRPVAADTLIHRDLIPGMGISHLSHVQELCLETALFDALPYPLLDQIADAVRESQSAAQVQSVFTVFFHAGTHR